MKLYAEGLLSQCYGVPVWSSLRSAYAGISGLKSRSSRPSDPWISERVGQFRVYVLFLYLVLWWCTHKYFSKILFYCMFSFKIPIKSRCSDLHNKIEYFFTLTKSGVRG